jgi:isopentenyl-diphosphate delta-isomerase
MEQVVLVDASDRAVGSVEKLAAHRPPGVLHRALSVFLLDGDGQILLQQRAADKHHFRGLWSNTTCTHPRPGEDLLAAGRRRLEEEMGITAELSSAGSFVYRAADPATDLVEHELDHVLVGRYDGEPAPDPSEVQDWAWMAAADLRGDLAGAPDRYTPWLAAALDLALRRGIQ